MLLVPLLAVCKFKWQLNTYNFVTVTECFMRGFSTDRGPSHSTGVPPLSSRVTFILECV